MREHLFGSGRWSRDRGGSSSNCVGVKMVRLLLILFSMVHGLSLPAFTLGSTRSEVSNDLSDKDYVYDIWETTQCGLYHHHEGVVESEHPFLRGTSCMYNVTSDYPIEVRFTKIQLKETYRCINDNVQLYVGSELLTWLCTEKKNWMKWRKLNSKQFGIYFEGLSNLSKYGFKLEWRMPPDLTSTLTTTTTTTTRTTTRRTTTTTTPSTTTRIITTTATASSIKALLARPVWASRMEKPSKAKKAPKTRTQHGMTKWQLRQQQRQEQRHAMMTGLFKAQYAKYKSKGVLQNKPDALSVLYRRFNKMIDDIFKKADRNGRVRRCTMQSSHIPSGMVQAVKKASSATHLISLLHDLIAWQDNKCKRVNPTAWLKWVPKRASGISQLEVRLQTRKRYKTILL